MSKSSPNPASVLFLTDSATTIRTKLKSAVTDSISGVSYDPIERPGVSNLLSIHSGYSGESVESIAQRFNKRERGIVEFKQELIEVVEEGLKGFRNEFDRIKNEQGWVEEMELKGARKAREMAEITMKEVRKAVGTA